MKFSILLLFVSVLTGQAQIKHTISGYVKDASNGEALIGATVFVRETSGGGITNVYGFYSVTVAAADYTIEISYVGYEKIVKQVSLANDIRLDIELKPEAEQLEEVVVTADDEKADKLNLMHNDWSSIKAMLGRPSL